jgi:hypothetical protein
MAESTEAEALKTRYSDGYLLARVTVGFGTTIKIAGWFLGGLIALVLLTVLGSIGGGGFGLIGILLGAAVVFFFYICGVLVSAQGQVLKAALDTAVNGSPFLTNTEKAEIMSLHKFPQSESVSAMSPAFAPTPSQAMPTRLCPRCAAQVREGVAFCGRCGAPVTG